jgi:pyruvate kinase
VQKRVKIVATVGPASADEAVLSHLLDVGMDVVRLNLSHGTQDDHRKIIQTIRRLGNNRRRFIPIIADLMGPRYRLGKIEDAPRMLAAGAEIKLGESSAVVDLPLEDPSFLHHVRPGERLLIDNGLIELEVIGKEKGAVLARVITGGPVSTRKGINLPDTDLPFSISEKDRRDIAFALQEGADYLAVSFVGSPSDLAAIRQVMEEQKGSLPLIAKLERARAVNEIDAIVQAADAVMVARGDLGVEVPLHRVPVLQKKIIRAGRRQGKPVIVATQMLESMMEHPRPTRAESSDVANAVFDGADALMLSGETAAGAYPIEAVRTMSEIIEEAEAYEPSALDRPLGDRAQHRPLSPGQAEVPYLNSDRDLHLEIPDLVCAAAVQTATGLQARHIIAFSQGGFTARMIARYRPQTPITVLTRNKSVARRLQLVWGTQPLLTVGDVSSLDEVVEVVDKALLDAGMAEPGDCIVILMGMPIHERPLTNLLRVHRVRQR